jgi:LysM repeat protein
VLVLVLLALVFGVLAGAQRPPIVASSERVKVERGESLWSIARTHPVPGQTTAQTADAIAQLSGLRDSAVQAGEVLLVPAVNDGVAVASR